MENDIAISTIKGMILLLSVFSLGTLMTLTHSYFKKSDTDSWFKYCFYWDIVYGKYNFKDRSDILYMINLFLWLIMLIIGFTVSSHYLGKLLF